MIREKSGALVVIRSPAAIFWPGALTLGYPGVMGPHWQKMFGAGQGAVGNCQFFILAMNGIFMFVAGKLQEKYRQ